MALRPPPYWECFASDWLAKEGFRLATLAERGLLFSMLCQSWVSDSLPREIPSLARILGIDPVEVEENLSPIVLQFFEKDSAGRLFSPELANQKAGMLERREERSRSGKRGAKARYRKGKADASSAMAQPDHAATATPEMNRDESKRTEPRRNELLGQVVPTEHREWLNDYSKADRSLSRTN